MRSVFGYRRVSFGENLRMIVNCVKVFASWLYLEEGFVLLSSVCLNILFKTKMICLFCKFRIIDMLNI